MSTPLEPPGARPRDPRERDRAQGGRGAVPGPDRPTPVLPPPRRASPAWSSLALIVDPRLHLDRGLRPPGWWKWDHATPGDVENGGTPTLSLPTWLGGTGFAIGDHPFGQDEIGRDIFARVMKGTQTSLERDVRDQRAGRRHRHGRRRGRGLLPWRDRPVPDAVHRPVHHLPGHRDRRGPRQGRRSAGASGWRVALGAITWTTLARLVRGEFLTLREREFVDAAKVAGASSFRIIRKHMIPNAMGVIIVNTTLLASQAVLLETALSYLGFGIKSPDVSLGTMISEYQSAFSTRPVAVLVARPVHHPDRPVGQLHRRRPARRLRPAPEAGPVGSARWSRAARARGRRRAARQAEPTVMRDRAHAAQAEQRAAATLATREHADGGDQCAGARSVPAAGLLEAGVVEVARQRAAPRDGRRRRAAASLCCVACALPTGRGAGTPRRSPAVRRRAAAARSDRRQPRWPARARRPCAGCCATVHAAVGDLHVGRQKAAQPSRPNRASGAPYASSDVQARRRPVTSPSHGHRDRQGHAQRPGASATAAPRSSPWCGHDDTRQRRSVAPDRTERQLVSTLSTRIRPAPAGTPARPRTTDRSSRSRTSTSPSTSTASGSRRPSTSATTSTPARCSPSWVSPARARPSPRCRCSGCCPPTAASTRQRQAQGPGAGRADGCGPATGPRQGDRGHLPGADDCDEPRLHDRLPDRRDDPLALRHVAEARPRRGPSSC